MRSVSEQVLDDNWQGTGKPRFTRKPRFTGKQPLKQRWWLWTRNGQRYDAGARSFRLPDAASDRAAGRRRLSSADVRDDGQMLGQAPGTAADLRLLERVLRRLCDGDRGTVSAAGLSWSLYTSLCFRIVLPFSGLNHSIDKPVLLSMANLRDLIWAMCMYV